MKNVDEAMSLPWPELLNRLIEVVGRKLTAYIAGLLFRWKLYLSQTGGTVLYTSEPSASIASIWSSIRY
jgi:hypothetical protein